MFRLAAIITSKTRFEMMRVFLAQPPPELGVRETARKIGANPMQSRNELLLLKEAGLLKSRHVANSVQYSLDETCEAAAPLRQLFALSGKDGKPAAKRPSMGVGKK